MNPWPGPAVRHYGASMIEVAISLVIIALLVTLGIPSLSEWIHNSRIRTAADTILAGLQVARTEAVRRNANVQFTLNNPGTSGGTGWTVTLVSGNQQIQSAPDGEGTTKVIATPTPGDATAVTFTGIGRTPTKGLNADGSPVLTQIDIDTTALAASLSRELRVTISSGGQIRVCDPNVSASGTDPRAC